MVRQVIAVLCTAVALWANAQSTQWLTAGNLSQDPVNDFLGNQDPVPMNIRTENVRRFRLNYNETYTIGSFAGQVKNGSLLLCPKVDNFYTNGGPGPYTGLHLAAATNSVQQAGYRSHMGNGITMTGNGDQMYVGQLFNNEDFTDAGIVWSDNPGEYLADRLTFNFTSGYNSGASAGNTSFRGLQTMLVQPASSGQEAFVGIGDFDAVSATPNERLDILDGRLRIRKLPSSAEATTLDKYMVVDNTGVVHWRSLPVHCDWELNSGTKRVHSGSQDVGMNGNCPDRSWRYAIGATTGNYKLSVQHQAADDASAQGGLYAFTNGLTGSANAIYGVCTPGAAPSSTNQNSTGVYGLTSNVDWAGYGLRGGASGAPSDGSASAVVGVRGQGTTVSGTINKVYGGWGYAETNSGGTWTDSYGLYGESGGYGAITYSHGVYGYAWGGTHRYSIYGKAPTGGTTNWAGYFSGPNLCE